MADNLNFAVVAVNAAAHGGGTAYDPQRRAGDASRFPGPVFHYHVSFELDGQIAPGMLIEVPFGSKHMQGIVIDRAERAPVPETKPVSRVLVDSPVLSECQIALALWLSERYLAPLIDCLRLMLPPGMLRQPRAVFRLHPEVPIPDRLPDGQAAVIDLLQRHPTLTLGQIAQRLKGRERANRALRALVRRGVVIRTGDLPAPRAQPKRVNFVRLSASPPQVEGVRPFLGRTTAQAALLQTLLDIDDLLPAVEHVLARAAVSASTLSTVHGKGWVEVTPERVLVQAASGAREVDLGRAGRQRAVLDYLLAQGVPVEENALREATNVSASTLRALEERALIRRLAEPATVHLCLDRVEALAQIVGLRGAARQHRVLDYLLTRPVDGWTWVSWVYAETGCTLDDLRALEGHGLIELAEREVWRDPLHGRDFAPDIPPTLTPEQAQAWAEIEPHLVWKKTAVFLLHGVTGSGKTEIYLRAVERTLSEGRQAIVLVPEISLTPQAIRRFAERFAARFAAHFKGGLGVIHSALSDGERYDTWRRIRAGQIRLVIGPRSALFAPLDDIGLIVLDEEHDDSYKQGDRPPTYHARDVAFKIAEFYGATVLLGSATPDLGTSYRARTLKRASEICDIHLLKLMQRILNRHTFSPFPAVADQPGLLLTDALPPVRVVDMRHELRAGNRSMFSRPLQEAMQQTLSAGEQMILFLNRRGTSTFVLCRDCGTVVKCPRCDIPLAYHSSGEALGCHHCNYQQPVPDLCATCGSHRIRYFGTGTQRVEDAVRELLPQARILRWDQDAVREAGGHETLLDLFARHEADVLIGTQMIAKGLDLPMVTLVGVITADTALNLPDFRAAERTFQLLVQVAGRAGRGLRGGKVIVQTYAPDHYAIQAAAKHDYEAFYARELAFRRQVGYPPFTRLARLVYADSSAARARQQAVELAAALQTAIQRGRLPQDHHLIGPAPCFLKRLRGRWRWQIVVRGSDPHALLSQVDIPAGWHLDIDPLNVL
ncbi:MAG: primosomal protein N' [Anaerolineae bacterium]|nr:primosomal protein N' [Anaerolineae bacterium]